MGLSFRPWVAMAAVTAGSTLIFTPVAASAAASAPGDGAPVVTVVANGLDNPKHITFGPGGLYITESGTGGSSCVSSGGVQYCEGETASVALLGWGGIRTVLSGLPSVVDPTEGTLGPAAVTFIHGRLAVLFQDTAVNPDGTTAVQGPGADVFGKLLLARPFSDSSGWSLGPDIAAFAAANPQNPATLGGPPGFETTYDSDPYAIVRYDGGYAIADAAANDVLWLSRQGRPAFSARIP
jgi:hypothetical protein